MFPEMRLPLGPAGLASRAGVQPAWSHGTDPAFEGFNALPSLPRNSQ